MKSRNVATAESTQEPAETTSHKGYRNGRVKALLSQGPLPAILLSTADVVEKLVPGQPEADASSEDSSESSCFTTYDGSSEKLVLSRDERKTWIAICDTLITPLNEEDSAAMEAACERTGCATKQQVSAYCRHSASDLGIPTLLERLLSKHLPPDTVLSIRIFLKAMSTKPGMLALCGVPGPFAGLSRSRREAALLMLGRSRIPDLRKSFQDLKTVICLKAFGGGAMLSPICGDLPSNAPSWPILGYKGPEPDQCVKRATDDAQRDEHVFQMINSDIEGDTELTFDVVIVGSGCGGAMVAKELAEAGHRVLIVEKGEYLRRCQLSGVEGDALDRMYERGCMWPTEDSGIRILAGATFGGGTAVNWAGALRTPDHVRREWAEEHGLKHFATAEFDLSLDAVTQRIGVKTEVAQNRNNQLLIEGCRKCGYDINALPNAMADVSADAPGAGSIGVGDRYAIKQSMVETFLRDAATAAVPCKFADRCRVTHVVHRDGVASGVHAKITGVDGDSYSLNVNAPVVVVACGALSSPPLLLRSGLDNRNKQIGKNLRLHPVSLCFAMVPDSEPDVAMWQGAPMTSVSEQFLVGPESKNYGCRLECPSILPGMLAAATPWHGGREFKQSMMQCGRLQSTMVLTRDRGCGEVRVDKRGEPRVYYPFEDHDRQSMLNGLEKAIRAAAAAGATKIGTTQDRLHGLRTMPPQSTPEARAQAVDKLIADVRAIGFPYFGASLFSAHQMGTCKMGSSESNSVVGEDGQSWEVSGLYIADTSTFPTSSGTNPMVTCLAIAHSIAQQLKRRLAEAGASG